MDDDPRFYVLAQLSPNATAETALYTVPINEHIIANEIIVCNRDAVASSFRISISLDGGVTDVSEYLYFDLPIQANDTFANDMKLTLGVGSVIRVYSGSGLLTFTLFGAKT